MERLFYFLVVCFLNIKFLSCQTTNLESYNINYQWINFKTEDSTYHFTLFIEQNGLYHFEEGFSDTSMIPKKKIFTLIEDDKSVTYERHFCFISEIKNIYDNIYLSFDQVDPIVSLELSYLIRKIQEEQIDTSKSMVKVMFPCENINFYNDLFFFEIKNKNEEPYLSVLKFRSEDIKGIKLVGKEDFELKRKDIEKVKRKIKNLENINNITCVNSLKPSFIEYREDNTFERHIFTSYCIDKNSPQEEVLKFYYWFLGLARSYTELDCSRELKNRMPKSF